MSEALRKNLATIAPYWQEQFSGHALHFYCSVRYKIEGGCQANLQNFEQNTCWIISPGPFARPGKMHLIAGVLLGTFVGVPSANLRGAARE